LDPKYKAKLTVMWLQQEKVKVLEFPSQAPDLNIIEYGKTFSIWKLSDLHDLEVYVSLFLFGEVYKGHWKTEPGTVMGILNPNLMKPKDGYDGVRGLCLLSLVYLPGEAQDFGTCKATKMNGEHLVSQHAELQLSFSGKVKGKTNSLNERLCQTGLHCGGLSSPACTAAL
uniref:MCM10 OB-fold domain-containing protein n=1 Tax=Esox lucius TaxID=8010 RepID=A0A3P8ZE24_ESOLU